MTRKLKHILLVLLIFAVSISNIIWIIYDTRPQPLIDGYAESTLRFINNLSQDGVASLPVLIEKLSFGSRPPLYQLLAVPFGWLWGHSADALLGVNIVFGIVLIIATYQIAKLAKNGQAGLLAALLVSSYAPILNLSRIFRPHSAIPACVALSIWLLLLFCRERSPKFAWLLGISIGFGVLMHPNFLYVVPAPCAVVFFYMLFFQNRPRKPTRINQLPRWLVIKLRDPLLWTGILPAVLIAVGLAAVWYIPHLDGILRLIRHSASNYSGVRLGFYRTPLSFWWYARTMPGAISWFFSLLLAISLAFYVFKRKLFLSILALAFLIMYCGFSLRKGALAWMNFAAVLPIAAVLTASLIIDIRKLSCSPGLPICLKRIFGVSSAVLLVATISVAVFIFCAISWGVPPVGRSLLDALGTPQDKTCSWRMTVALCPNPPRRENWMMVDILKRVIEDRGSEDTWEELVVVSNRSPDTFNHSSLRYYLYQEFPGAKLTVSPIVPPREWPNIRNYYINWLTGKYVVYIPGIKNFQYSEAVASFLDNQPASFEESHQEIGKFVLPDGSVAILIKRIKPPTVEELKTSVEMLDIPESVKSHLLDKVEVWFAE